jgi:cell wall-associated NlpC family hydrolase
MDLGGNPPTSSKGAAAVWWAGKALGRPYVWAATGPNAFDCSGLTMWAYSHVGISLPHYSRAQYNSGPHVGRSHLKPGDLVFFGSPIHHVGMYIGGGQFIEAPHSGADVRISNLGNRGDYAGACRP